MYNYSRPKGWRLVCELCTQDTEESHLTKFRQIFSSPCNCSEIRANRFITKQSTWPKKASYDLGRLLHAGGYKAKTDAYLLYRYIYIYTAISINVVGLKSS